MSRVWVSAVLVVLWGCPGKDGSTTTGDTDTSTGDSDTETTPTAMTGNSGVSGDSGTTGGERVVITKASATCDDLDVLTLFAEANGWAAGGMVFMQETGGVEPQYNEVHSILTYEEGTAGTFDRLRATLTTGATAPYTPGTNTVFTCAKQIEAVDKKGVPTMMTYIVVILDSLGDATDCMVFGHDPMGLLSGDYTAQTDPPVIIKDLVALNRCVVGMNITP